MFPARAGINRRILLLSCPAESVPRGSGDKPLLSRIVCLGGCASLTHPAYKLAGLPLTDPQKLPVPALDCAINRHTARVGLQSPGATDIMRPARLTTLSMGALLVLPQRYSVYQVRSGRKQPRQMTCVPGCSWQGPHPFLP